MTITNTFYTDATVRRAVYIERLKTGQRIQYDAVLKKLVERLTRIMTIYNVDKISDLSNRQLSRLLNEMNVALDYESYQFVKKLMLWLKVLNKDENDWNTQLMVKTIDEKKHPAVPYAFTAALMLNNPLNSTGLTIADSWKAVIKTQQDVLTRKVKIAAAQNRPMREVIKEVIGTAGAKFKDGLVNQLRNIGHEMIGSVIQHAVTSSRYGFLDKYQDWVSGYMWVSVLDSRTSAICRSLDGQVFETGNGPMPPMHPNCRSHVTAVFKEGTKFLKGLTRKATDGVIDAGVTYYEWLKKQTAAFQDSVLGKTRGALFRRGGLSATEFARLNVGRDFEQLTLDELRDLYPEMFKEAGLD